MTEKESQLNAHLNPLLQGEGFCLIPTWFNAFWLAPFGRVSSFERMKLPNVLSAVIEREKIVDYLLNPTHPDNGGKAAFFLSLGFNQDDWHNLAMALGKLAKKAEITKSVETIHGCKYVLEGPIETPGGKSPKVRTVWIVDRGRDNTLRLVSAYPCQE